MFRKSKSLIGLDIGSHSAKAVELTSQGGETFVSAVATTELPTGDEKTEVLANLIRSADFHTKRSVTAVSGKSVIVRYLTMPRMTDEELPKALEFEADKYIPFDMSDVIKDCQRLSERGELGADLEEDKMRVLLVAAKRNLVEDAVAAAQRVGLQAAVVDVDSFAIGNAFDLFRRFRPPGEHESEVVALVDIGARKTSINILHGDQSCFTREIYMGGNDFTQAVSKRLAMRLEDAEHFKRDPGDSEGDLEEALAQAFDDLGGEILLSFDYYENQFESRVEEVLLSGGSARMPILAPTFERIFNRPTTIWNPMEHFPVRLTDGNEDMLAEGSSQLAVALGLASRIRKER